MQRHHGTRGIVGTLGMQLKVCSAGHAVCSVETHLHARTSERMTMRSHRVGVTDAVVALARDQRTISTAGAAPKLFGFSSFSKLAASVPADWRAPVQVSIHSAAEAEPRPRRFTAIVAPGA